MAEHDFESRPVGTRNPKAFEPPPWEKEAFEDLQRLRAAQQEAEACEAAVLEDEVSSVRPAGKLPAEEETVIAEPVSAGKVETGEQEVPPSGSAKDDKLDQATLNKLLAELAAEEAQAAREMGFIGVIAEVLLVIAGVLLMVWGVAALAGTRQSGWIGVTAGGGLGLFGASFIGVGGWLLYKDLKKRGVL